VLRRALFARAPEFVFRCHDDSLTGRADAERSGSRHL
jgi:hypothetical protein